MNHAGLTRQLLAICLAVLLAALMLRWAVRIFEEIWPQLAIGAGVVMAVVGLVALVRQRNSRW